MGSIIDYNELNNIKLSMTNRFVLEEAIVRGVQIERLAPRKLKLTHCYKSYITKRGRVANAYNSKLAIKCTDLKEVTSQLLRSKGYPTPENCVFQSTEPERAWQWSSSILPVVLKPHNSILGKHVNVKVSDYEEFIYCFNQIAQDFEEVLIEQFCEGEEYRFTYILGEIVAVAKRIPANIVGDGKSTIEQLVNNKNRERERSGNPIHKKVPLDNEAVRLLSLEGWSSHSVPGKGKVVYLRRNSNVSTGGDAVDVTNDIDKEIKDLIAKAASSIKGLRVCGIDVILNKNSANILEINSYSMLSMHHYPWVGEPRNVAGVLLEAMFPTLKK